MKVIHKTNHNTKRGVKLRSIGNSMGVIIPSSFINQIGIKDSVDLAVVEGKIHIEASSTESKLKELLIKERKKFSKDDPKFVAEFKRSAKNYTNTDSDLFAVRMFE